MKITYQSPVIEEEDIDDDDDDDLAEEVARLAGVFVGYPGEAELDRIKSWPVGSYDDYEDLFEYISDRWYPDGDPGSRVNGRYRFATGGWSGNEDMIGALRSNHLAWAMTWQASKRGGLHIFQIPENLKGEK